MPVRLGRFEMPKRLTKEESTATETYAKFVAEPFETGYGHTIGNSLRRVLLSSLEGAAITSVKIDGAMHEFTTVDGVVEDVTDLVLNLKKILFRAHSREPQVLLLSANKDGEVTAADIQLNQNLELVNPKQLICTLDRKHKFDAELEVRVGRGFATGEENKRADQPIGLIPIDSIFSPVTRVKYAVENTRVGQRTDYDKLIRLFPATDLRHHVVGRDRPADVIRDGILEANFFSGLEQTGDTLTIFSCKKHLRVALDVIIKAADVPIEQILVASGDEGNGNGPCFLSGA